jgi:hypothetical protein
LTGQIPDQIPEELEKAAYDLATALHNGKETDAIISGITDAKAKKTLSKLMKKGVEWAPKEIKRLSGMMEGKSISDQKRGLFNDRKVLLETFVQAKDEL